MKLIFDTESIPELEKSQALIEELLSEDKLWKLSTHADPFVRRATYRLLSVALNKRKHSLNPSAISSNILKAGLHANQVGSAFDFVKVVSFLSIELPDVWTIHYKGSGKTSAHNRLCYFLKKGSQGGPPDFWTQISSLITSLPLSVLLNAEGNNHTDDSDAEKRSHSEVLNALHEGLSSKDEPRSNHSSGWKCYLDTFEHVEASLPQSANHTQFYKDCVFPLVIQYIRPSPDLSRWTVLGIRQQEICLRACNIALLKYPHALGEQWQELSGKIVEDLRTSLPEQSKEHAKSQDFLSAETERWYHLQGTLLGGPTSEFLRPMVEQIIPSEVESIVSILKARHGKPYGAAAALESCLKWTTEIAMSNQTIKKTLLQFVKNDIPSLVLSPSAKHLIHILGLLEDEDDVSHAYEKSIQNLTNSPESPSKANALQTFISSQRLANHNSLSTIVFNSLRHALENDDEASWTLVIAAVVNPAASRNVTDEILATMVDCVPSSEENSGGLHGLELVAKQKHSVIKDFALSEKGPKLLSTLLVLSECGDPTVSRRAKDLSTLVEQAMAASGNAGQLTKPLLEMISSSIGNAASDSLFVGSVISRAQNLYEQTSQEEMPGLAAELLPNITQWTAVTKPFLTRVPNPSLAITNAFGGALSLIPHASPASVKEAVPRDSNGYSSAFRVLVYTIKLIEATKIFDYATSEHKVVICKNVALLLQLAGDDLSISGSMSLWDPQDPDQESEIVDLVADMQRLLISWLQADSPYAEFLPAVQNELLEDANGSTAVSYYSGRAYSLVSTEFRELHGYVINNNDTERLQTIRKSTDVFAAAGYLTSATQSKELQKLGNELLADMTGLDLQTHMEEGT